ncbi:MAG: chemotaxis protein CheC [Myxococcota bacterium]
MRELSDTQVEALTEIINVGIGVAASALSDMAGDEVLLSTPHVDFLPPEEVIRFVDKDIGTKISAVKQNFAGPFDGDVLLLFPERQSLELVRALLRDTVPLEAMTEMEQEAMCEVGNVLLNATVSALADALDTEIETGLPEALLCQGEELVPAGDAAKDWVMFLRVDFSLAKTAVRGYVAFLMGLGSIRELGARLEDYLTRIYAAIG